MTLWPMIWYAVLHKLRDGWAALSGEGQCVRCRRTWSHVMGRVTIYYTDSRGFSPLCGECWDATAGERGLWAARAMDEAEKRGCRYDRTAILGAVAESES